MKLMAASAEREHHVAHPLEQRPNVFAKDTIKIHHTDDYSRMKSVMAQISYQIEEKKRVAREEEAKKRADKKKKPLEGEVVVGG